MAHIQAKPSMKTKKVVEQKIKKILTFSNFLEIEIIYNRYVVVVFQLNMVGNKLITKIKREIRMTTDCPV